MRQQNRNPKITQTAENYLLSISVLHEDGIHPHISELAAYLRRIPEGEEVGTTLASVSGMIQRMTKDGLLEITKDKRILLTSVGMSYAKNVVRRHRLSERLLVDLLGIPLERAESEAHSLEHGISEELLSKIEQKLNYPKTCPYGRPIYQASDKAIASSDSASIKLSEAIEGNQYKIIRIPDEDYPLLSFLVTNKILPGEMITVNERAIYRGVIDISHAASNLSLGMDVASRIRVGTIN
ncbi:MAG: hypothetical protein CL763_00700 [Chloroflexi bacterium]|nr:hypothetical protein [Chloroflexota bacterium]|tara:strand:- start:1389 stop:2105 length:717 start_codon:yes stop_codon:yes gene_type:complete